jgi:hypothetical protein
MLTMPFTAFPPRTSRRRFTVVACLGACLSNHSVGLLFRLKVIGEVCQFQRHGEDLPLLPS